MNPDFAIVGAPKCGTTALYSYLGAHPGIAMSRSKEPVFWSSDLAKPEPVSRAEYDALWNGAPAEALRGEASTRYLRSEVAIDAIQRENPAARFIAMVRNPVDMAAALHAELLISFQEDEGDFEGAWRLQGVRAEGERIPPDCFEPKNLQYARACALGDQLERFFCRVPEERRHVILLDDLATDPGAVYAGTLAFLGVDHDGRRSFERVHAGRTLRWPGLTRAYRSVPRRMGALYMPARRVARAVGVSPSELLTRVNTRSGPRRPLRPAFREELAKAFAPQVEKIEALLERDLSHWR